MKRIHLKHWLVGNLFPLSLLLFGSHELLAQGTYKENPGTEGNGNFIIGPEYSIDRDLTDLGNPKGKYFEFSMRLADSKIFRGDDKTLDPKKPVREERKIFVYVPAAYVDGTEAPLLVIHDGPGQLKLVRNALDNLTISKDEKRKLPAFITIAVQNGGNDSYGSQRGLEYDTMSDRLARFINDEVLPAVLANKEIRAAYPKIAFTKNPWGRAVMGCSSGGAAALSMGWFRPDLFRRLITYSGTFVDQQDDDAAEEKEFPLGAWEYHSGRKLIENSEKKPLRIFTHVSEFDNRAKDPEETYHNWVMANERTAAALKAKGYDYRYVYSKATRHCDGKVFEQTLADTLVWMWRGYHADTPSPAVSNRGNRPNPVLAAITEQEGLPRVLLIGDSISMGYTLPVREQFRGKANILRPSVNCGPTTRGVESIEAWLGKGKWDVIHFNFGLHDIVYYSEDGKSRVEPSAKGARHQVPVAEYEANLRTIVKRLKETGATLIWASTTPVPEGSSGRVADEATDYNQVAARIMKENGVTINDLHAFAAPQLAKIQQPKNVHFTQEGSKVLAGKVSEAIEEALKKQNTKK